MRKNEFFPGKRFKLYEVLHKGKSDIRRFLDKLPIKESAKIMAFLVRIANNGPPINEEKFRHEGDQIYAIKSGQVRIYCCYFGKKIILLTNGVIKKSRKARPADIEKAKRIRKEAEGLF